MKDEKETGRPSREDSAVAPSDAYKAFTKDKRKRINTSSTEKVEYQRRESSRDDNSSQEGYRERRSYNPNFSADNRPTGERREGRGYTPRDGEQKRTYGEKREYTPRSNYEDRKPYSPRKEYGQGDGENKRSYGDRNSYTQRGSYGERREYTPRDNNSERPSYGEKRSYGEKKEYTPRTGAYGQRKEYGQRDGSSYGQRKEYGQRDGGSYGQRKEYGQRDGGSYGQRKEYGQRDGNGERPQYGEKREYSPRNNNYGGSRDGGERRSYGNDRRQGDYQQRGSKPYQSRSGGDRPSYNKPQYTSDNYPTFPAPVIEDTIRLNRYISMSGICSRREADTFIQSGVVTVNDVVVTEMGAKVCATDVIKFNGNVLSNEKKVYIVMNKPKGYVTSVEDPHAEKTVMDLLNNGCKERVYPVGRLDKSSLGVLLITNDGDLAKKLTHPSYEKKKVYQVTLDKPLTKVDMDSIVNGITLEDGEIHADAISYVMGKKNEIGIEIHSGRNRIVRRMFEHLGYRVMKLDRVYFSGLTKQRLKRGEWRFLTPREVQNLRTGQYE